MVRIIKRHWSFLAEMCFLLFFFVSIFLSSKFFYSNPTPTRGAWLATSTWIGGATGNWQNAANWDNGIPTSTVLAIISSSTAVTITATGTLDFDTLQVGGGTASSTLILEGTIGAGVDINIKNNGTITQSSTVQQTISGTLLIESGGLLNHAPNTTTQSRIVNFNATSITLNSGGTISSTNAGYSPGQGPGVATGATAGGAHGGNGGNGVGTGGQGYCNITNVGTIGSGGGDDSTGGAGGGLIILTATGTITINGSITANGQAGVSANTGGGAGGGIKLTADIIAGTPSSFTAAGGNGNNGYGGGGGGCVDIFFTTSNTIIPTSSYFSINGGTGTLAANYRGGGGMALVKQTGVNNGGLYVLNGGSTLAVTQPTSTISAITADFIFVSSSIFQVTSSKIFTLVNTNPFFGNNLGEIRVYGSMVPSVGTFSSINSTTLSIMSGGSVAVSSTFTASSSLNLYKGFVGIATDTFTNLIIQTGTTTVYNYTTSSALLLSNLTMNGGILTHDVNAAFQSSTLNVSATGNITINSGSSINVSSTGYTATRGPGVGSGNNAGGGHGGDGNDYTVSTNGGRGYCDITNVSTIGSGGSLAGSGTGGGLIILSATSTITINGSIIADGGNGVSANTGGGGGGGIRLTADIIAGTPTSFTAKGGNGVSSAGGGGGGCVDIFFTTSNTIIPTSSYFSVSGGSGDVALHRGGGGMALVKQTGVNNGGLFVLNGGSTSAVTQPTSTVPAITADFIHVSSSIFQVTSSKVFTLVNTNPFFGNNLGEIRVYGRMTSTVSTFTSINSTTLTIGSGGSVSVSSTFMASSSLNLYKGFIGTATDTFTNLIIQTGTTTVYNYTTSSALLLSNLTMNGGVLTHEANAAFQSSTLNVSATGNITVNSGGAISSNNAGYDAGQGPGIATGATAGGAHGGNGGNGLGTGGQGYCDITDVGTIGSGGGGSTGGAGGGLIILTATGTITINGSITANGQAGVSANTGGGAGGGIKLTADIIAGTPTSFTAAGGNGNAGYGGGGGGCVDIFYTTSNTISATSSYFSINGGTGTFANYRGGGGMALVKQTGVNNGGLYVLDGGLTLVPTQPTSTVPAITADFIYVSSSIFIVTSSKTLTLANSNPFFGNDLGEIRVYGSLVRSVGGFESINSTTLTIASGATFSASSTLIVSSSLNLYRGFVGIATDTFTNLIIQSGTTTVYNYTTSSVPLSLTSLTMNSSSVLASATNTTAQASIIYITASTTININAGATVFANATGYNGGSSLIAGYGPGGGLTTTAKGGGGGAHGGNGGAGADSGGPGGTAYCSSTNPVTIGSGGGGGNSAGFGGNGGGFIWFSSTGTITINGNIKANGGAGANTAGGGAGGGIKLVAGIVAGTPQSLTASGGNGGTTGGGGGGGCIYIQYITSNSITSAMATTTFGTSGTGSSGTVGTFQAVVLNSAPTVTNIFPRQTSANIITVTTTIADADLNGTTLAVLYSTDGTTWASSTIAAVDENGVGNGVATSTGLISGIDTNVSGSINLTFGWNAGIDIANTEDSTVYIKITPNDGTEDGTAVSSTAFSVDTKAPTASGNLVLFNTSTQSVTFTFGSASVEPNFAQYIIYYKAGSSGVAITDTAITSTTDANLGFINYNGATSTTRSGLVTSTQYVFNIWAYDNFSSTPAASEVVFYTLATVPSSVVATVNSQTQITLSWIAGATESFAENTTAGTNSGWISTTSSVFSGLTCNTAYSFRVKARNGGGVETSFSSAVIATTDACSETSTGGTATPVTVTPPPVIIPPEEETPPFPEEPTSTEPVAPTPPPEEETQIPAEEPVAKEAPITPSESETTVHSNPSEPGTEPAPSGGGSSETAPSSGNSPGTAGLFSQVGTVIVDNVFRIASFGAFQQVKDQVIEIAKEVAERAVQVAKIVNEIKNIPEVKVAAEKVVPQATVSVVAVSSITLFPWADVLALLRLLFLQPLLLLGRPKKSKAGQVYNTLSKLPVSLVLVRLVDIESNRIIQTRVTDAHGNYFFIVNPGKYRLEVRKNEFNFPSSLLAGVEDDGRKANIYHGEVIEILQEGEGDFWLAADIPLDPVGADKKPSRLLFDKLRKSTQLVLSWAGLVFTAISFYISPKWYIAALFFVHLLLFALFRYLVMVRKPKNWGVISDTGDKKPISRAVARLFNLRFNKLVATEITDYKGRYSFIAGDDQYYVTAEHPNYTGLKSDVVDFTGKESEVVAPDMSLKQVG